MDNSSLSERCAKFDLIFNSWMVYRLTLTLRIYRIEA